MQVNRGINTMKTTTAMRTTFINTSKEDRTALRKIGRSHLVSRAEDFRFWMKHGTDLEMYDPDEWSEETYKEMEKEFSNRGSFYDYGLSVDYVSPEPMDDDIRGYKEGYLRYQLSYGGPSEEIRFYFDQFGKVTRIEFVYLDWFKGVGFDVTREDWAQWLWDWFKDTGTVEAEINKVL